MLTQPIPALPVVPVNEVPLDFDKKALETGELSQHVEHAGPTASPAPGLIRGGDDAEHKLTRQTILACVAIATQINAYIMTLLIPSTTLGYINADLGPDPSYTWITVSWTLGAAVVVSVGGRLSDIFGRRYFMMFGAAVSIVGCLVGANATSINMMIASGVLFGIGSGFQEMCYAIIQEMLPNKHRIIGVVGGFIVAFISSRVHREKWQLVFFMVAQTALIGSLASVGVADKAQAIVTIVLGAAMVTPPQLVSFTMLSLTLDDQNDIGIAVGLAGTFRLLGGAIATAIYSAILSSKFSQVIPDKMVDAIAESGVQYSDVLLQALVKAGTTNTAAAYKAVQGATPALQAAAAMATKLAYVDAFSLVYLIAIAFGAVATAATFLTVNTDMKLKTMRKAVYLKGERPTDETLGEKAV
ncbi:hypothetical protein KJ359_002030 [Pestalotiopsis sp. 9143b]|nr:hypothetical protein KJ359_002030 [Pestalotiopsis sp. 9143b]